MIKIKAAASGFDGVKTYQAGDIVEASLDHARLAVAHAGAVPLGDDETPMPAAEAAKLLRLGPAEARALAARAKARPKKKGT